MIRIHHVCIETSDYRKSLDFYSSILGFETIEECPGFHGREYNAWLRNDDAIIELQTLRNKTENASMGNIGLMHVCFQIDDLDAFISRIKSFGFTNFKDGKEKYQVNGKYLCKIIAPEGTVIEVREG